MKILVRKYSLILLHLFVAALLCNAQKTNNFWYFGDRVGLDFNSSPPKVLTNTNIKTNEGCSSVSDENGELLFYTDGTTIWNKKHKRMPNGFDLRGNNSSTQSSVVVRRPSSDSIYYIFNPGIYERTPSGFHYSIVDMSLDGGDGDVVTKNVVLLSDNAAEKIAVIKSNSNCGYWVITHSKYNDTFYSYFLDESGIQNPPVISKVGFNYTRIKKSTIGYLNASPDGNKLAAAIYRSAFEIYDFDKSTGKVSNAQTLETGNGNYYGCIFSPNGRYIYMGTISDSSIFQFDLTASSTSDIIASKKTISNTIINQPGALQIGPDGRMYIALYNQRKLAVITNPNEKAENINFLAGGLNLPFNCRFGLPSFINDDNFSFVYSLDLGNDTLICASSYELKSGLKATDNFIWSTGDETPNINITKSGLYWMRAPSSCYGDLSDTINIEIIGDLAQDFSIGNDTLVCSGSLKLGSGLSSKTKHLWSTGDTTPSITVTQNGNYKLSISNKCIGNLEDSVRVTLLTDTIPFFELGNDTSLCNTSFKLTSNLSSGINHIWNTGEKGNTITVTENGKYKLTIKDDCYARSDSISIVLIKDTISAINLGNDTLICEDEYELELPIIIGAKYKWNTNDTLPVIKTTKAGKYVAELYTPICNNTYRDSINVDFYTSKDLVLKEDTTVCEKNFSNGIQLSVNDDFTDYLWSNGGNLSSTTVVTDGLHTVSVTDTCKTPYTKSINVTVCHCELYVPNAFTPNDDGDNDVFTITNDCGFTAYELKIFNRWGALIFESKNMRKAWNGTYKGLPVPEGVYLVSLRYNHKGDRRNPNYKSFLTVIR